MIWKSRVIIVLVIPLFFLFSSITLPSQFHRYSIETMDYRWSNDGVSMEYLRRKSYANTLDFLSCKYLSGKKSDPCCYVQKSDLRHNYLLISFIFPLDVIRNAFRQSKSANVFLMTAFFFCCVCPNT